MKSAKHKVLVALLVVCIVLGYAPTALAGTQIHVTLSSTDHVIRVEAQLSFDPEPWVCARQGGSNLYKVSDDSQFVTNDILYIEVFFDNGTSQKYYNPSAASGPYFEPGNESGGTLNVDIDVVMPPTTGTVTITKVQADGSDDFSADLEFTVTLTDGVHNYSSDKLTVNNPVTLDDVVPGTYTVTETLPVTNWGTPVIEVDGVATNQLTVAAGGTYEVTITNTYNTPQSTLTILYKVEETNELLVDPPNTYPDDVGKTVNLFALAFEGYTLKEGQTNPFPYTYGEEDYTHTFWYVPSTVPQSTLTVLHKVEGTNEVLDTESYTQDLDTQIPVSARLFDDHVLKAGEDESYVHTFTNTDYTYTFWYVPKVTTGTIRVIKTVYDVPENFDYNTEFSVTVAGTNEGNTYSETKSVKHGEDNYVDFEVPPGSYSITETPADGWSVAAQLGQDVEVGDLKIVRIPNFYLYSLIVTKVVDQEAGTYDAEQEFNIEVTPVPLNPTFAPQALGEPLTASLKAGQSRTFEGLRAGSYTVTEVTEGLPDGWECLIPVQTVVVGGTSATATCTVENKYVEDEEPVGLKVVKLGDGNFTDPSNPSFTIYVQPQMVATAVDGDSNGIQWPLSVDLKIGESHTFDLEPGTYEVFEDQAELPVGWVWLAETSDVTVEVTEGNTTTANVINRYTPPLGHLTVYKARSHQGDSYQGNQKFKVCIEPYDMQTYTVLDDESWPLYKELGIGQSFTFLNLAPGFYRVYEEDLPENWRSEISEQIVEVLDGLQNVDVFVRNIYTAPEDPPPPPPDTSLLTVYYKEWGTDDAVRAPTSHSGYLGASQVVSAFEVEGYELREGEAASYTHEFGSGNATYTFWYETIIPDEPPPLAPTGGVSATMMYGIGVSLLGLGLATKKRRR